MSQFAAEPSLDLQGNPYFTHRFCKAGRMIEADTYVARPRCPPGRSASGWTETYIQEPSLPYFGTPKYRERHLPREGGYR